MTIKETAYAKINLALHVRRRREDGYHELETLFAFVDCGDFLTARSAQHDSVETIGEFAGGIENPFDNLVAKALSVLPHPDGLAITLEKNLPIAAGLGGGSADAGAVFRIVRERHGLPDDWRERAAKLGADVPACVESVACIGRGTGTELLPVKNDLSGMPVLLVNPRKPVSTGPVFAAWDGVDRGPMPEGTVDDITRKGRNDLLFPAQQFCPEIAQVLEDMNDSDPYRVGMSGSGATCWAIYKTADHRDKAARELAEQEPQWWMMRGNLR
ncbi:4-(cytidine 5'-diphospho)-2-C-methyl-D-erythritol kinase [Altererythrobacter sp. MF3-039]|uniref:4-(cytidine 5'-diphospho)-2-C-methyl-D-erythritol kinase n=1 Tax=Altererythrobacter sp. MF3-039 TaxID=3252901 RepID=UPI00390CAC57